MSKHPLTKIKWGIPPVTVYKGVLVQKVGKEFKVLNTVVATPKEVDKTIKEAKQHLYKSIR